MKNERYRTFIEEIKITLDTMWEWNSNEFLEELEECLGVKSLNTHGLPFNGTTFELFREVEIDGRNFKEVIGHLKYVIEIYGGEVSVFLYNNKVQGGAFLNGIESRDYIYKTTFGSKKKTKRNTWGRGE